MNWSFTPVSSFPVFSCSLSFVFIKLLQVQFPTWKTQNSSSSDVVRASTEHVQKQSLFTVQVKCHCRLQVFYFISFFMRIINADWVYVPSACQLNSIYFLHFFLAIDITSCYYLQSFCVTRLEHYTHVWSFWGLMRKYLMTFETGETWPDLTWLDLHVSPLTTKVYKFILKYKLTLVPNLKRFPQGAI